MADLPPNVPHKRFLDSYSPVEWPNLSSRRQPNDAWYQIFREPPSTYLPNDVLAILGPLLGSYCGVSDLLLGFDRGFRRVSWTETTKASVTVGDEWSMEELRHALQMGPNQYPAMAQLCFSSPPRLEFPFTLTFTGQQITLAGNSLHIHPTVASVLLDQLICKLSLKDLPVELMSVSRRVPPAELASVHPNVSLVDFADEYLSRRAQAQPDSVAVEWFSSLDEGRLCGERITCRELDQKANQLARWMLCNGLKLEDRVAVCMERSLFFHVALFAILRAGGCYVPIDPDLPLERKRYIVNDSNAVFVFVGRDSLDTFKGLETRALLPEEVALAGVSSEQPRDIVTPENLAFLLYTSGTTGTPKGCLLTHHSLAQAIFGLGAAARNVEMDWTKGKYLAVASIAFDVHLAEQFLSLVLGLPLLAAPRAALLENLPHWIKVLGISHVGIVPSLIEATLMTVDDGEGDMNLRYIASGGEKMSDSILDKWSSHPLIRLANFYGPSEVTIGCCSRNMDPDTPKANIGTAFANVSAYVIDSDLNILPRGAVGELLVEGPLVGRGYHRRDDLTKKVFLPWQGGWAYRTGDLVRMMPDSTLEILGRIDTQIKLRGVRIESEGISAVVRSAVPSSTTFRLDAITLIAKHPALPSEQLVTFISWDPTVSISTRKSAVQPTLISAPSGVLESVQRQCHQELASYMRPSHVVPLTWLPLNGNGKADAKALHALFVGLDINSLIQRGKSSLERPLNDTECRILGLLETHMGVSIPESQRNPSLSVFTFGLDSMGVIRFCADIKQSFNRLVAAPDIMKNPTIEGISDLLSRPVPVPEAAESYCDSFTTKFSAEIQEAYPSSLVQVESILPCFSLQPGVLARSAEGAEIDAYVQHVVLQLHQAVDMARLKAAWEAATRRHGILRTVFHFGQSLVQVVMHPRSCTTPWKTNDQPILGTSFADWFMSSQASPVAADINRTISTVPAFRLNIFNSELESLLVLSIHHALFDGISLPLILREVERSYSTPSAILPLPVSPRAILEAVAQVDEVKAQTYYLNHFSDFVWPRRMRSPSPGDPMVMSIPFQRGFKEVKAAAAEQKVTMQALLTCAYASLLASSPLLSGVTTDDVTFGVIRTGRLLPVEGIETAVYPTLSILPVRVKFSPDHNALLSVQEGISSSVEFEHIPLSKVQRWVRPSGQEALFETLFSVSFKSPDESDIWAVAKSGLGGIDHILSVEVVVDPHADTVTIQGIWDDRLDLTAVHELFFTFEQTAFDFSQGGSHAHRSGRSIAPPTEDSDSEPVEEWESSDADPALLVTLQSVISTFLNIDPALISETTSIVALGLDSIKSVGLARKMREAGLTVNAVELLKCATIIRIAMFLTHNQLKLSSGAVGKFEGQSAEYKHLCSQIMSEYAQTTYYRANQSTYPATTLQSGMISQTLASGGGLYIHAFPLVLSPLVDVTQLRESWTRAIDRLSILRTSFHYAVELGLWTQVVHPPSGSIDWNTGTFDHDTTYNQRVTDFIASARWSEEEDFRRTPLKFLLLEPSTTSATAAKERRLIILLHHALYDGISIEKLLHTVRAIYLAEQIPPPVQFHDLIPNIIDQETGATKFWARKLNGYEVSPIPQRSADGSIKFNVADQHISFNIDETVSKTGVTIQCLGQAAMAKVLWTLTNTSDIVFGHVVSGRAIPGAEDVIGPVLNTIPCRVRCEDQMTNIMLLNSIHSSNVAALPWQHTSLRSIHQALEIPKLWDALFLFEPWEPSGGSGGALWNYETVEDHDSRGQYPLNVEVQQLASGLLVKAACRSDILSEMDLKTLLGRFETILKVIAECPHDSVLRDIPEVRQFHRSAKNVRPKPISLPSPSLIGPFANDLTDILSTVTLLPSTSISSSLSLIGLGIDSITAIQIVSKFKKRGLRITASDIINSGTTGDLLQKVQHIDDTDAQTKPVDVNVPDASLPTIAATRSTIEHVRHVSAGTKWLIGAWQNSGGNRFQHAFSFILPPDIVTAKLKYAWISLVVRHEILRSTFACVPDGNQPCMVTFLAEAVLPEQVWTQKSVSGSISSAVGTTMMELVSSPIQLDKPLARAVFLRSAKGCRLILHLHHVQYDAWSLQLLMSDLTALYYDLPPKSSNNLVGFIQSVYPRHDTEIIQRDYWQSVFPRDFSPILFPAPHNTNTPLSGWGGLLKPISSVWTLLRWCFSFLTQTQRPQVEAKSPSRTIYTLPIAIQSASKCEERARSQSTSLSSVMLAGWAKVHAESTESDVCTFALWQSGRTGSLDDVGHLAVPCMNVLPMCVRGMKRESLVDIAQDIQSDLQRRVDAVEQSDLERIDEWVGGKGKPLCNVFINLVKVAPEVEHDGPFKPETLPYQVPSTHQKLPLDDLAITSLIQDDIMLDIAVDEGKDAILMSVDTSILTEGQARDLVARWVVYVKQALKM